MARDNTPETPVANGPYKARSRSGCVTCRQRHLKCDEIKPTCGRCRKSRRQCVPTDLDHRATRGSVVRFVDESSRFYRRSGTREPDDEPPAGWSVTEVGINSPTATIFEQQVGLAQPLTERLLSPPRDETDSELGSFETITDRSVVDDDRSTNERQNTHDSQSNHRTTLGSPQSPFETTAWWNQISSKRAVLDDYEVYRLMRHYVEVVGPWLDLTDSKRHYSTVVPQLALKCPVLMNAILAFSARHLHRLEGYEAMIAEYYHNEAIKVMIPMLQDQAVANDGTLLATTIILRMYETLEPSGQDVQQHLGGSCSLIGANGLTAHSDDLHKASFWLYLRQDIHMAELHQKRTIIDLENCAFVEHLLAADHANPDVWANHIYWILGLVVNYCFGSHLAPSYHRWLTLREMVSKWREDTPESYFPCFFADPVGDVPGEGNVFPVIWLLSDIYVTANQAWHTCNILLSLYSPLPTTGGFDEFRHRRSEQTQIINHARRLCGISITNESDSARICASPQLALAGRCLETAEERNRLLRIFADLNTSTTWPVAPFIASLEKYWGSAG